MMTATEKWSPIIEILGVINYDNVVKMSEYADKFTKMEILKDNNVDSLGINLLPINLKILSKLDNFEITDDISQVNDITYKIKIDKNSNKSSLEYVNELENSLINIMIDDLKEKNILIYSLVNNIFIESDKLIIVSRIKINN